MRSSDIEGEELVLGSPESPRAHTNLCVYIYIYAHRRIYTYLFYIFFIYVYVYTYPYYVARTAPEYTPEPSFNQSGHYMQRSRQGQTGGIVATIVCEDS